MDDTKAFRRHEKVVAVEDLPGVPTGTRGRVLLVDGITWIRYRVLFDNGVERGSLDGSVLANAKQWEREQAADRLASRS